MRSLVKSGDTERIVFFATAARNKEIYILAANYLQTLNWKEDGDLIKQIESFYNKANSYEHLSSFYEACAQVFNYLFTCKICYISEIHNCLSQITSICTLRNRMNKTFSSNKLENWKSLPIKN